MDEIGKRNIIWIKEKLSKADDIIHILQFRRNCLSSSRAHANGDLRFTIAFKIVSLKPWILGMYNGSYITLMVVSKKSRWWRQEKTGKKYNCDTKIEIRGGKKEKNSIIERGWL